MAGHLTARTDHSYPMPATAPFTLADSMQAVVAGGRATFGSFEGQVFAVAMAGGATAWSASLPGRTVYAGAVTDDLSLAVFLSFAEDLNAFRTADGTQARTYRPRKIFTRAPLLAGGRVFAADHGGWVHALDAGHVAPIDVHHADGSPVGYGETCLLHLAPGRSVTALAAAYEYLTAALQAAVRTSRPGWAGPTGTAPRARTSRW